MAVVLYQNVTPMRQHAIGRLCALVTHARISCSLAAASTESTFIASGCRGRIVSPTDAGRRVTRAVTAEPPRYSARLCEVLESNEA